jgi:integral membrane sensor domain MASE1
LLFDGALFGALFGALLGALLGALFSALFCKTHTFNKDFICISLQNSFGNLSNRPLSFLNIKVGILELS